VRLYQGRIDIPLSELGHAQAERLAAQLRTEGLGEIWYSPLRRTRVTAEALAAATGAACRPDDRLLELSFGGWEGRSHEEVREREPEALRRHLDDILGGTPPGGEPVGALLVRLEDFLRERWTEGTARVAVVTHEGVIRAAAVLLGLLPLQRFHGFLPPPGSALEVRSGSNGCGPTVCVHGAPASVLDALLV
jgi:probable phosphoglycerate mutase